MLPKVKIYSEKESVGIFGDTGIQFLDLACTLDLRREPAGEFAVLSSGLLTRLYVDDDGKMFFESEPEKLEPARSKLNMDMKSSLEMLDSVWLPIPFFRFLSTSRFDEGPSNWARIRIVKLAQPDELGNTHRITLAFDTHIIPKRSGVAYLAPNDEDLSSGSLFRLAFSLPEMRWFLDQAWVTEWLAEVFHDRSEGKDRDEVKRELEAMHHVAHYLNLLSLLRGPAPTTRPEIKPKVCVPKLVVKHLGRSGVGTTIPVDLVLDVGNSRTCGILVEDHGQSGSGLHDNGLLVLRDMTQPELVYDHPFDSRVEFAKIDFGKEHLSAKSGRHDAFSWATMARVGTEALNLASRREGTEGSTGLSSPKRYLWDEKRYEHGWRLNTANLKGDAEPLATTQPLANLIDETGTALYDSEDGLPVFTPCYTRSSLMTFMLNEVLAQAVMQINSVLYRSEKPNAATARLLRTVILTMPPGMPQAERTIFKSRVMQALGLLWKSLGWYQGDDDPAALQGESANLLVPFPKVVVQWDEATCGQLVYLYTEAGENFGGHPEEFFDVIAREDKTDRERITVASIDIGGGTSDLVINDYRLNRGEGAKAGSNVQILPEQRFRDGFKVAGDDIVLDIIRQFVLPSFALALRDAGVTHPEILMHDLCGAQSVGAKDAVLRQQLTLQVFHPLALALLGEYERYDLENAVDIKTASYGDWLGQGAKVSATVQSYVTDAISRAVGRPVSFEIAKVALTSNPAAIHAAFLSDKLDICKTLASLCEVVSHYNCDVLLLTGRPSRLPGVLAVIRRLMPLPAGRILPLQNYRTGVWFPFHKAGLIADPKTTASVGAMLCWLCENHRIPNFYFSPSSLKPAAIIRHFGNIDFNNTIKADDVLFHDIVTSAEEGCIQLPLEGEGENAQPAPFLMHGDVRLGYRQLAVQRWPGAPMYTLSFSPEWLANYKRQQESGTVKGDPKVRVYFKVKEPTTKERKIGLVSDRLVIANVELEGDGPTVSKQNVHLELNTLLRTSLAQNSYWLDSGSVAI